MPCTTILVGKKASYDGSTMIARNDDSGANGFTPKKFIVISSKEQKRKHVKLTMFAILVFTVLLAISYQNSQITVKFNQMQDQKKKLSAIQKENEQLDINKLTARTADRQSAS